MASAAITLGLKPTKIASDTDARKITVTMITTGILAHKQGAQVSIAFDQAVVAPVANVNKIGQIEIDPGDSVRIPKGTQEINHETQAGTAELWFVPDVTDPNRI